MKKILFYNILIFFILIALIEVFFGYWFDENNFGILMRKHRMQTSIYQVKFDEKIYKHTYRRNFYGFRGGEIDPKFQKIIFIGGSTGNQKYTPEELTIVEQLNEKLINKNINEKIYNASMDGKSTFGIINDFEFWFPKLNQFSPKLFIFYIGLNDKFYRGNCQLGNEEKFDRNDCQISFDLNDRIIDYIKNNSITYALLKKIKYQYFNTEIKLRYNFFGYGGVDKLYKDFDYTNYEQAKKIHYSVNRTDEQIFVEKELFKRLNKISEYVKNYNAEAIYITQVQHDGLKQKNLFYANEIIKKFCRENNYTLIALDEFAIMNEGDFYDPWHTTLKGSKKITNYISPIIINKIEQIFETKN